MKRRPSPTLLAAALLLAVGASCASQPDSAWGTFAGAWQDGWNDSSAFVREEFLLAGNDDPYNRPDAGAVQGDHTGRAAGRLLLDRGDTSDERIPRSNPRREENSARSFFHWLLDVD
jgi:hypothetical protein